MRRIASVLPVLLSLFFNHAAAQGIHDAVRSGDIAAVDSLLSADPGLLELRTLHENTPLMLAVWHGHDDVVKLLLDRGADVGARNEREGTAMHYAALFGHPDAIDLLAANGADVDALDDGGFTPMTWACYAGHADVAGRLVALGADLGHKSTSGMTLMHAAAYGGHAEIIEFLVESGLTCNPGLDEPGNTPLFGALFQEHSDAARALIERGADIHALRPDSTTALHLSAERGLYEVVRLLLDKGARIDARNSEGETPLIVATENGRSQIAALLLEKGADPNAAAKDGRRALHEASRNGLSDLVSALLSRGADPNVRESHFGWSPLHIAAANGYGAVAVSLMEYKAQIESVDNKGRTPLQLAAAHSHKDVTAILENGGAEDDAIEKSFGPSPLLKDKLAKGEAHIWYLGQSGWAVKTSKHLLIFDYVPRDPLPDDPLLANGHVTEAELRHMNVSVFVTHDHEDHYDPSILKWKDRIDDITYVFGFDPDTLQGSEVLEPRESRMIKGMKVSTIQSTDAGVGFIVEVDGLTLFHAGDHANTTTELSAPFTREIDHIAEQGPAIDIAFLPVVACGSQNRECPRTGVFYSLDKLSPRVLFPMHAGGREHIYMEFAREAEQRGVKKTQIGCPEIRGDRFFYKNGKIM